MQKRQTPFKSSVAGRPAGAFWAGRRPRGATSEDGPLRPVSGRFEAAVEVLGPSPGMVRYLRTPQRRLFVSVPIRLEDGSPKVYTSCRVIHNGQMRPAEGGIRCT